MSSIWMNIKFVVIYNYTVKIIIRQGLFYYIDKSTNCMCFYICDIPDLTYEHGNQGDGSVDKSPNMKI